MKKICFVATIPAVVHAFLREHIKAASEKYLVTVICNSTDIHLLNGLKARLILMPIQRKPSPFSDLMMLLKLYLCFRQEQFDIIHTHMPKTGLLGILAAWFARSPIRIHTFHGEVWATRTGYRRKILKFLDRFVAFLATDILLVSHSQRDFLISEKVLTQKMGKILGDGSACGVDPLRFHPDIIYRLNIRKKLNIDINTKLILFVGRLNREKGVLDLAMAFEEILKNNYDVDLLLVGSEEDIPFSNIQKICGSAVRRLHYLPFTSNPEQFMAAADIFCLPSYREGFGMTIIESAACGIPTVASKIYGITDAVTDGRTGLLYPVGSVEGLTENLLKLINNDKLRKTLGCNARTRALEFFPCERITFEMISLYGSLIDRYQNERFG